MTELTRLYQLTEALRAELFQVLDELYEIYQDINGPRPPFEALLDKFREPITIEVCDSPVMTEFFTEEDKQAIFNMCCDEAGDESRREGGERLMYELDFMSCIAYAGEGLEELHRCLKAVQEGNCDLDDLRSGEHDGHKEAADFMTRMGLVDEESVITARGLQFLEEYPED